MHPKSYRLGSFFAGFCPIQFTHIIRDYCQTSNICHTLVANKFADQSNVIGASTVGAAPTTSSFQLEPWLQWIEQRQL